jgi:PhnB protein
MLIVPDADAAVGWYRRAIGATELWNLSGAAGLQVQGAPFFVHADALADEALAAGTTLGCAVEDHQHFPGAVHRQGGFRDPFGHTWSVGDRSPLQARR